MEEKTEEENETAFIPWTGSDDDEDIPGARATPPPPRATPPPPQRDSIFRNTPTTPTDRRMSSPPATPMSRRSLLTSSSYQSQKSTRTVVRRVSTAQCLSTGKSGTVTDMQVEVLEDSTRKPMDPNERRRKEFRNKLQKFGSKRNKLFKAAAENIIAENRVEAQLASQDFDNKKEMGGGVDLFRNLAQEVVTRKRFTRFFSKGQNDQEQEIHHLHGRLSVQESHHVGDDLYGSSSSSSSSSSSISGDSLDEKKPKKSKRPKRPHYRLALRKGNKGNCVVQLLQAVGISAGSDGIYDSTGGTSTCRCFGIAPNELVTSYLHWTFRTTFATYFLSAFLSFLFLTVLFAFLIWASGTNHPDCIHVNGVEFGNQTNWGDFLDAYALSWTTFSTVGYGLVFPSTSAQVSDHRDCVGISTLTTLESYVGILFASVTGAIVFSKITRVRSQAQVVFSDPIVIKYGNGVLGDIDDASSTNHSGSRGDSGSPMSGMLDPNSRYPFPVLEFRVVNRLNNALKGEIMDCVMQIVASIDARNADPSMQRMAGHYRRRKGKKRGIRRPPPGGFKKESTSLVDHPPITETKAHSFSDIGQSKSNESSVAGNEHVTRRRKSTAFDEEINGKLVPRRIFSKLEIDGGPDHPFFKRVWIARHTLDLHSPLLTMEARQRIRLNGGRWPPEFNTYEAVREAVSFDQILVSFSGTSNVDANSVYAQKVYEYGDINVGYTFVTMLYRDLRDGSLKCDLTLLNDVIEQSGGGGEPLDGIDRDDGDSDDKLSGIVVL